ncbi:D-2-hydroxyacid dehydrogenase [Dyadobacter frigoris]|uniref:D-2-hydroxyacid dehydrogenase n=1 Tax=Dyadobacter frigoris TaxID=2576211 RepID=A0A4U6DC77_9BACT|nr:D-2-hydroxyacid dehydrogenase [Dyadobacter frigoris]TKT91964.1 D-2-hydroxyacid dehydrogenase [Dyadobacter frigoris]GLU53164.1 2-hydroxyacid dehydrogenase [Dyadobacter frigoris]
MVIYCHANFDDVLRNRLTEVLSPKYTIHFQSDTQSKTEAQNLFFEADYILGNPPLDWFSEPLNNLKFWQLDSAGFDQYASVRLNGQTKVANMGDWFARPCAESIVGGILALYRGIDKLTLLKEKTEWVGAPLRAELRLLSGQEVVILGAGTIGSTVKLLLQGFGCTLHLMARTSPDADIHSKEDLLNVLPNTDLVINTLPGSAANFADQAMFQAMKKGSVYASVGRGSTTDEQALIEVLNSKHLDGAVLDVTEIEPIPNDNPLWKMDNVILSQHTGGGHADEHVGKVDLFLNNIMTIENGGTPINEINLAKGY